MGNSNKRKKYGVMTLEAIASEYYTGSLVSGIISIDLVEDLSSNQLTIELIGCENVNFVRIKAPRDNAAIDASVTSTTRKRNVFYETLNLSPNSKKFYKGSYHFPFSFKLPIKLPSTFNVKFRKERDMCYGGIDYCIRATAGKGNKRIVIERPVTIKEVYSINNVSTNITNQKSVNSQEFSVSINKNTFIVSDSVRATIFFDNTSSKDKIKSFVWKTELRIKLTAGNTTQELFMELNKGTLDGVTANQRYEKDFLVDLRIPNRDLQDIITFKGNLIDISYVLKIYAVSPVMAIFSKKTKIKFFLNVLNYRPVEYVDTVGVDDNIRVDLVVRDVNRLNMAPVVSHQANNDRRLKERVTLPLYLQTNDNELNRRFTAMPSRNDGGFDYPNYDNVSVDAKSEVVDDKIKIYTVPVKVESCQYNDLDEIKYQLNDSNQFYS